MKVPPGTEERPAASRATVLAEISTGGCWRKFPVFIRKGVIRIERIYGDGTTVASDA